MADIVMTAAQAEQIRRYFIGVIEELPQQRRTSKVNELNILLRGIIPNCCVTDDAWP